MKPEPVILEAPGLKQAVSEIVAAHLPAGGPIVVLGQQRLAGHLDLEPGPILTDSDWRSGLSGLGAVVAVGRLSSVPASQMAALLQSWAAALVPEGLLIVAELAAEGSLGRRILGALRRVRGRAGLSPSDVSALLLGAGFRPVHQVWPQSVGSWMLTWGHKAPLARWREGDGRTGGAE